MNREERVWLYWSQEASTSQLHRRLETCQDILRHPNAYDTAVLAQEQQIRIHGIARGKEKVSDEWVETEKQEMQWWEKHKQDIANLLAARSTK